MFGGMRQVPLANRCIQNGPVCLTRPEVLVQWWTTSGSGSGGGEGGGNAGSVGVVVGDGFSLFFHRRQTGKRGYEIAIMM